LPVLKPPVGEASNSEAEGGRPATAKRGSIMGLIQLIFSIYFIFLLIRLAVPNTGQMAFNQPYQLVVRFTRPVLEFLGKPFRRTPTALPAAVAIAALIFLQGLIYSGGEGISRYYDLKLVEKAYFDSIAFNPAASLWGVGLSIIYFLGLTYQFYFFLFLVTLVSPLQSSPDQISRLMKTLAFPMRKNRRGGGGSLLILAVGFAGTFYLLQMLFHSAGWTFSDPDILVKSVLAALALPLQLIGLIIILIVIRAILSWFPLSGRGRETISWLHALTYPVLYPFRKLKLNLGAFDLTPVVAIFALYLLRRLLEAVLIHCCRALM